MGPVSPTAPEQDVWVRTIVGWHVAFWAMLAIVTVAVVADPELSGPRRLVAVGLLAVLAVAYAVLGTPASRSRDAARATRLSARVDPGRADSRRDRPAHVVHAVPGRSAGVVPVATGSATA